jgi:hypothetical protein
MSQYSSSFLSAQSTELTTFSSLSGQYDIALLSASWDSRSTCILEATKLRIGRSILLTFAFRDRAGLCDTHETELSDFLSSRSDEVKVINGEATEVESLWHQIRGEIYGCPKGRPLRALVDLSAIPRYFASSFLSECVRTGFVNTIDIIYAEATYDLTDAKDGFSVGASRIVTVPNLEGDYSPTKNRWYFLSLGWDGPRTLRVVAQGEPDRVSLLLPDPGFQPNYFEETLKQNRGLIDRYRVPEMQIVRASAGDAVSAWRRIAQANVERIDSENSHYFLTGTKPHSIALTLRAIELRTPIVQYVVPDTHRVVRTKPTSKRWLYSISDQTAI